VFDDKSAADEFKKELKNGDQYEIEERPSKYVRCEGDYCSVSKWCDQWQRELAELAAAEPAD
jgi:hypothetical protein